MPRPRPTEPTLKLNSAGIYEILHWVGDERRRISTGSKDAPRAKQELADYQIAIRRKPASIYTVTDALKDYLADREGNVLALGRSREATIPMIAYMGHLRLDQIDQQRWSMYTAQRVTRPRLRAKNHNPRLVSRGTLRREYNVLRAAMNLAVSSELLAKMPRMVAPADSTPRKEFLLPEECKALLDEAAGHVKTFLALGLMTGARRTSILTLTWDRVDFHANVIDYPEPGRQKSDKRRATVPINPQLRAILREAQTTADPTCPYVVQYAGKSVITGLRASFSKLCSRAGVRTVTPHVMKHTAVSILAKKGIPIEQASKMLATDRRTLERVYMHVDASYLQPAADALQF